MKTTIKYIVSLALLFAVNDAWAWCDKGHDVISILATERLAPKSRKQVEKILGGDIRSNALWLNTLKTGDMAAVAAEWHNTTISADGRSVTADDNDGVVLLERNIEILRNRAQHSDSEVATALRTVIHLVGDLHCVAHIRFEDIPHSHNFKFYRTKGNTMNKAKCQKMTWYQLWSKWYFDIHAAFSAEMFAEEIRLCQGGEFASYVSVAPRLWVEEMGREARPLIEYIQPEEILDNATSFNWERVHERCVAKAAVRLAALLNDIFK